MPSNLEPQHSPVDVRRFVRDEVGPYAGDLPLNISSRALRIDSDCVYQHWVGHAALYNQLADITTELYVEAIQSTGLSFDDYIAEQEIGVVQTNVRLKDEALANLKEISVSLLAYRGMYHCIYDEDEAMVSQTKAADYAAVPGIDAKLGVFGFTLERSGDISYVEAHLTDPAIDTGDNTVASFSRWLTDADVLPAMPNADAARAHDRPLLPHISTEQQC